MFRQNHFEISDRFINDTYWIENEVILPSQLSNKNQLYMSGELRLAEQLLWSSLEELRQSFRPVASAIFIRKRENRAEILDWIFTDSKNPEEQLSISLICDALGMELSSLREGVDRLAILWSYSAGEYPVLLGMPSREDSGGHKGSQVSVITNYKKGGKHKNRSAIPKLDWIKRFK
jgi:hypothetical protein